MLDRVVLTELEFCKAVNISRTKCWRLRKRGQIPHLRIGDRIGFLQKHIDEFLNSCEQGSSHRKHIRTNRRDG
jgi:predicted DNA-binding transcriptional regulator AlpA